MDPKIGLITHCRAPIKLLLLGCEQPRSLLIRMSHSQRNARKTSCKCLPNLDVNCSHLHWHQTNNAATRAVVYSLRMLKIASHMWTCNECREHGDVGLRNAVLRSPCPPVHQGLRRYLRSRKVAVRKAVHSRQSIAALAYRRSASNPNVPRIISPVTSTEGIFSWSSSASTLCTETMSTPDVTCMESCCSSYSSTTFELLCLIIERPGNLCPMGQFIGFPHLIDYSCCCIEHLCASYLGNSLLCIGREEEALGSVELVV